MKRIIVIISMMFLNIFSTNAQNNKCNYLCFIHTIDSLKNALRYGKTIETPKNYWNFNDLSIEERNQILDSIEIFYNQRKYNSFYYLGINLLVDFFNNNDKTVQDRIARLYLNKVFYVFDSEFTNLGKVADYSDSTKERLKNILEGKQTEEDKEARMLLAKRNVQKHYSNDINKEVKKMMNGTKDSSIKICLKDSLTNAYIKKEIHYYNSYPPLERYTIFQIGSSKDKRFVDGLESILTTDYPPVYPVTDKQYWEYQINTIKQACTYALAKLGVQKYINEILANDTNINYSYLGTKEAYLRWLKINFDWKKSSRFTTIDPYYPNPVIIMPEVSDYVKNIPKNLQVQYPDVDNYLDYFDKMNNEQKENYDPLKDEKNKEIIQKIYRLYNWIKNNPDKWELPPARDRF